jgi:hypothetical protein
MPSRTPATSRLFVFVAVGLVLGLAGCGADGRLTAPAPGQGTVQAGVNPVVQKSDSPKVNTISVPIDGAIGGVVAIGHSILTISPGAFVGTKTITMECDNASGKECRLYPEGLQFSRPVQLTIKLRGSAIDGPGATIYWWDPMAGLWVDIMGTYDANGHTVTADLQHFSVYRGGRAGW